MKRLDENGWNRMRTLVVFFAASSAYAAYQEKGIVAGTVAWLLPITVLHLVRYVLTIKERP